MYEFGKSAFADGELFRMEGKRLSEPQAVQKVSVGCFVRKLVIVLLK